MSLLRFVLDDYPVFRPSRMVDQHFGLVLHPEDLLQPSTVPGLIARCPAGYIRNWKSLASEKDSGSTVEFDKNQFKANLDVTQFKPEEISVKVTGENTITIEGKHEEKEDEHGQIYRHFVRRYVVPKNCDMNGIKSQLSSDGVLTITAPRIDAGEVEYKNIPITQTGESAKTVEKK